MLRCVNPGEGLCLSIDQISFHFTVSQLRTLADCAGIPFPISVLDLICLKQANASEVLAQLDLSVLKVLNGSGLLPSSVN